MRDSFYYFQYARDLHPPNHKTRLPARDGGKSAHRAYAQAHAIVLFSWTHYIIKGISSSIESVSEIG